MPSKRPHRVIPSRKHEPASCRHRGAHAGHHYGHCTACHEIDGLSIATTGVWSHLVWGLLDLVTMKPHAALLQFVWAFTRLTKTGEYRHGGYFDSRYPGWRLG